MHDDVLSIDLMARQPRRVGYSGNVNERQSNERSRIKARTPDQAEHESNCADAGKSKDEQGSDAFEGRCGKLKP